MTSRATTLVLALGLAGLAALSQAMAQDLPPQGAEEFSPGFLRVPMQLDDQILPTSILLEVPQRPLAGNLESFAEQNQDPTSLAFARLMRSFIDKERQQAATYHQQIPFEDNPSQAMADLFIDGFDGAWPSLSMVRQYDLGREMDYVWEVSIEGQPFRRVTRISTDPAALQNDDFWLEAMNESGMTNLQNVLAEAEQAILEGDAELLDDSNPIGRDHRFEVPGTEAWWRFDGISASFDAFAAEPGALPDHPVAAFFHRANQVLKSEDAEAYAELFTPTSAQRVLEWAAGLPEGGFAQYAQDMQKEGRHVVFVLEGDPFYFVFYETTDGRTAYQVIHSPEEGQYQLANFYVEGIFDGMLRDEDFFVNPVLRPLFGEGPEQVDPLDEPVANVSEPADPPEEEAAEPEMAEEEPTSAAPDPTPRDSATDAPAPESESRPMALLVPIGIGILVLLAVIVLLLLFQKRK